MTEEQLDKEIDKVIELSKKNPNYGTGTIRVMIQDIIKKHVKEVVGGIEKKFHKMTNEDGYEFYWLHMHDFEEQKKEVGL